MNLTTPQLNHMTVTGRTAYPFGLDRWEPDSLLGERPKLSYVHIITFDRLLLLLRQSHLVDQRCK